jgi:hypothetical protein
MGAFLRRTAWVWQRVDSIEKVKPMFLREQSERFTSVPASFRKSAVRRSQPPESQPGGQGAVFMAAVKGTLKPALPKLILKPILGAAPAPDLGGRVGNLRLEHFGNPPKSFGVFPPVFSVLPFSFNP